MTTIESKQLYFKKLITSLNKLNSSFLKSTKYFKKNDGNQLPPFHGFVKEMFDNSDTFFFLEHTKLSITNNLLVFINFNQTNFNYLENDTISFFSLNNSYIQNENYFSLDHFVKRVDYFCYFFNLFKKYNFSNQSNASFRVDLFEKVFFESNIDDLFYTYLDFSTNKSKIQEYNLKKLDFFEKRKSLNNTIKGNKGRLKGFKNKNNKPTKHISEINSNIKEINRLEKIITELKTRNFNLINEDINKSEKTMVDAKNEVKILREKIKKENDFFFSFSDNNFNKYLIKYICAI